MSDVWAHKAIGGIEIFDDRSVFGVSRRAYEHFVELGEMFEPWDGYYRRCRELLEGNI